MIYSWKGESIFTQFDQSFDSSSFAFFTTVAISLIVQHIQDLLALRTPTPTPTVATTVVQEESNSSSVESQGQTNSALQAAKRRLAKELSRPHWLLWRWWWWWHRPIFLNHQWILSENGLVLLPWTFIYLDLICVSFGIESCQLKLESIDFLCGL